VDGAKPLWPGSQVADSPQRGIELVDSLYNAGADFIKVYSRLTPECFYAIAKRCSELNLKFVGHVPRKLKLVEACNAGMYSMEHLYGVTEAFSDIEDSIFAVVNKMNFAEGNPMEIAGLNAHVTSLLVKSKIVHEKVDKVCAILREHHTWITPTLVVNRSLAYLDVMDTIADERFDYLPHEVTNSWKVKNDFRVRSRTARQWQDAKTIYANNIEQLRLLNQNNVAILAGTDLGNPYCFPGSSLQEEFELMKEAGMTSLQILQTATLNPAKYLNKTDSLGTISPGKYADILLVADNPLDNISNVKKIEGLCGNGKFYNKRDLELLKQKAKDISAKMNEPNR
jgi:hypothetical protein